MRSSTILLALASAALLLFVVAFRFGNTAAGNSGSSKAAVTRLLADSSSWTTTEAPTASPSAHESRHEKGEEKTFDEVLNGNQQQHHTAAPAAASPSSDGTVTGNDGTANAAEFRQYARVVFPRWSSAQAKADERRRARRDARAGRKKEELAASSTTTNGGKKLRMTSDGSVAFLQTRDSIDALQRDAKTLGDMLACAQAPGMFWTTAARASGENNQDDAATTASSSAGRCEEIPSFKAPLRPWEISNQELSCASDGDVTAANASISSNSNRPRWVTTPFKFAKRVFDADTNASIQLGVLDRFFPEEHRAVGGIRKPPRWSVELRQSFSRFLFWTSWLFHKWLPWRPHNTMIVWPVAQEVASASEFEYRAFHNPAAEHLYQVNNFCLSPFGTISGIEVVESDGSRRSGAQSNVRKYRGRQDDRGIFHGGDAGEGVLGRFFNTPEHRVIQPVSMQRLLASKRPLAFDQRPVLFIPLDVPTKNNLGHLTLRALSAVAILEIIAKQHRAAEAAAAPLLVFVYEPSTERDDLMQLNKWAFFFRLMGGASSSSSSEEDEQLPYAAVVLLDNATSSSSSSPHSANYLSKLFMLAKHGAAFAVRTAVETRNGDDNNNNGGGGREDALPDPTVCFRVGYAAQTCSSAGTCIAEPTAVKADDPDTLPSYAFMNWIGLSPKRARIMDLFAAHLRRCIALPLAFAPPKADADAPPRVFVELRSQHRRIKNVNLFLEAVRQRVVGLGFASELVFREHDGGSRAAYLQDVFNSDVFVGVHGSALAQTMLMHKKNNRNNSNGTQSRGFGGGVVVELTESYFFCKGKPNCWFDIFTAFADADHWLVRLPVSSVAARNRHRAQFGASAGGGARSAGSFPVSPASLAVLLQQACCRWGLRNAKSLAACSPPLMATKLFARIPAARHRHVFEQMLPSEEAALAALSVSGGDQPIGGGAQTALATSAIFAAALSTNGLGPLFTRLNMELRELRTAYADAFASAPDAETARRELQERKIRLASDNVALWAPLAAYFVGAEAAAEGVAHMSTVEACMDPLQRDAVFGRERTPDCLPLICVDAVTEAISAPAPDADLDGAATPAPKRRRGGASTTERKRSQHCFFRY